MTFPEEIEQLKIKLAQTADERPDSYREQAGILLEILEKYSAIHSTGSQPYIDQLLALSEKLSEPLYKAWGLFHLSNIKYINKEDLVALELYNQALSVFDNIREVKGIASCYSGLGAVYERQGNYPEALRNNFTSLKLREEIGDRIGMAASYHNIAAVYVSQGNYPEALNNHFAALKLREAIGDKPGIAASYNGIGAIYHHKSNYPEALKNYSFALKLREAIGDKPGIAYSYNNIGSVYYAQANYPEASPTERDESFKQALKNHSASLKLQQEIGDKNGIAISYNNIAVVYRSQGNYPEALNNHFAALKLQQEMGYKYGIASSYKNIGLAYYGQGNYPNASPSERDESFRLAMKNLFTSLTLAEEMDAQHLIKVCSLSLSNNCKAINDYENALKYHEKYHHIESKILGEEAQKQLTNLGFMHNLEQKEKDLEIEQLRNVELKRERDRSENLLLNILPAEVAEELKAKGTADAKHFDEVTVLFTDFVGFTKVGERLTPQQLVDELHTCFSAFDAIMAKHNIEKIKTVGDAYLAVSGLPLANSSHAGDIVKAAIEIRDFMRQHKLETENRKLETFEIRIGVHSGSVVAGIVGVKKFAYDIWGDTVNTAARMEQNSQAGKINISQNTYELVKDNFTCEYRGEIEAKNKGKLKMYFVEGTNV